MTKRTPGSRFGRSSTTNNAQQRATASARADAAFLRDRRRQEAANLEKTLRLRALRLGKMPPDTGE
jgi:hypothetical protein